MLGTRTEIHKKLQEEFNKQIKLYDGSDSESDDECDKEIQIILGTCKSKFFLQKDESKRVDLDKVSEQLLKDSEKVKKVFKI